MGLALGLLNENEIQAYFVSHTFKRLKINQSFEGAAVTKCSNYNVVIWFALNKFTCLICSIYINQQVMCL